MNYHLDISLGKLKVGRSESNVVDLTQKGHFTSTTPSPQHLHSTNASGDAPINDLSMDTTNPHGVYS